MSDSDSDGFNTLITNGESNFWKSYKTTPALHEDNAPSTSKSNESKRKFELSSDSSSDDDDPQTESDNVSCIPTTCSNSESTAKDKNTTLLQAIMNTLTREDKDTPSSTTTNSTPTTRLTRSRAKKAKQSQPATFAESTHTELPPKTSKPNTRGKTRKNSRNTSQNEDPSKTPPYKPSSNEDLNHLVDVHVLWKSIYKKNFQIRRFTRLKAIVDHFAKLENVEPTHICFSLNDKIVDLNQHSCVTLKYRPFHEIEGGILDPDAYNVKLFNKIEKGIKLKVRLDRRCEYFTLDERIKSEHLYAHVILRFGLVFGKFKLVFDGSEIATWKCLQDAGLEDGDCIDIHI